MGLQNGYRLITEWEQGRDAWTSNHHLHILMILKRLEDAIALLLMVDDTAGVVAVKFAGFGSIAEVAEVLFVPHHFFDGGMQRLFVPTDELKAPLGGVLYLRFFLSFIV